MILTIFSQPIEAVFEEWHRRWTENPDGYRSWAEALAEPSDTYGRAATRTLLVIAQEMYDADEAMHPWEREIPPPPAPPPAGRPDTTAQQGREGRPGKFKQTTVER